ncbi:Sucrase-like protein [Citrus sinensis]|uniref:Sucrase-like protein n=1 Tax=Citrus sinensis TaxID=2711 RepID=A0ACB8P2F2_CITSI|nr:Sucrase-like protein [Citrus sinensis]
MSSNREEPLTFASSSPITVSDQLDNNSYHTDPSSHIGSASNSFQNDTFLSESSASINLDVEFGFSRPEFRLCQLAGTVDFYERHVFVCYKNPSVWPPRIEAAEFDRLPRLLSAAVGARKPDMKREDILGHLICRSTVYLKFLIMLMFGQLIVIRFGHMTRLTICEGHDGTETSNGDVLIFPDMIRYRRLTHFDVDTFVEEVLVKNSEWLPGTPEKLKGWYVFVCSHASRDRRCGVCGPPLVSRFKEEIETHGLLGKVSVSPCSHIGGHKYAGNVIIFGSNVNGEVTGHWYGYVAPDDVPTLLEQHIGKGEIVDWLWSSNGKFNADIFRGQMGLSSEEQKKFLELRLQLNGETNMESNNKEVAGKQLNGDNITACRSQVDVMSCCQENGDTCCQNTQSTVFPEKIDNPDADERAMKVSTDKKRSGKKLVSRSSSSKGAFTRKVCAMPTWLESWEREDTYAVLAVACAVVSVAVAYSCYKQLS